MSATLTKEQKLELIYRHTHRDYKGTAGLRWGENEGKPTIMVTAPNGGNALILLEWLSDADIEAKLPYALRKEKYRPRMAA